MNAYAARQKENSKVHIEKAIFECLEARSWKELCVSEVCQQAQLSRKTFYRHYDNLSACMNEWFRKREQEYLQMLGSGLILTHYDLSQIAEEFFAFWKPYRASLQILDRSGFDLQKNFMESAARIIACRGGKEQENLTLFSSGGFCSLWIHWIRQESGSCQEKRQNKGTSPIEESR